jgi:hypothetical protein
MKRSSFTLFALLLSLSTTGCAPGVAKSESAATHAVESPPIEAQDGEPWEIVLQREIEQPMRVAAFLDDAFGVTGGPSDAGKAHYTTDGGATWTSAESSIS